MKTVRLSQLFSATLFARRALLGRVIFVALTVSLGANFAGCTKPNLSSQSKSSKRPTNLFKTEVVGSGLTLTSALRENSGMADTITLLGDGSGAIGNYCTPDPDVSGTGCQCHITFLRDSGGEEEINTDPRYYEPDLIRCAMDPIPADAKSVTIRLRVVVGSGDVAYSNAKTLDLDAPGQGDTRNAFNFLPVRRYQCREILSVNYSFGGSLYDPVLSVSPMIVQTQNYFSQNIGGHLMEWSQGDITKSRGYECQQDPDLDIFGNRSLFYDSTLAPTGTNAVDTNFLLARTPASSFVRPVNAWVTPTLGKTIGYAAKSINTNGHRGVDAEESCPNANLAANKKMVKIWLFRAKMPDRKYPYSREFVAPERDDYNPTMLMTPMVRTGVLSSIFPTCASSDINNNAYLDASQGKTPSTLLMRRADSTGDDSYYCGLRNQGTITLPSLAGGLYNLNPVPYLSQNGNSVDLWRGFNCATFPFAPFRMCHNNNGTQHRESGLGSAQVPLIYADLDPATSDGNEMATYQIPGPANRYDFIYVTTPTTFNTKDWQHTSAPKRWVGEDATCETNPAACTLVNYELKLGDPTRSFGDINETEGPIFPLCAVQ